MESTIVVRFLRHLSKRERMGLGLFIKNPFFNPNEDVIKLFHYLEQFAPAYKHKKFTAENAYKSIYPNKTFHAATFHGLTNRLFTLIKKFISSLQNNSIEIEIDVLRFCIKRYPERFDNQLKKVRNLLNKNEKGAMFYYYTLQVEHELSDYLALNSNKRNYTVFSEVLDKFYWLTKLPLLCEILNFKGIRADDEFDFSHLDAHLKFVEQIKYTQFSLVGLWHCLLCIMKNILNEVPITIQEYLRFKELFLQNKDNLDKNEQRNLYIYLRNTIRLSSFEDTDYYREEFEIDQMGLDEKFIFLEGQLREHSVKNIVNSAIKVGKIEWAKKFLQDYKDVFWKASADDIFLYCMAIIDFHEGDFDKALTCFNAVEYKNIFFEIEKRIKLIQIYYEKENVESFDKHVNNLGAFISRNKDRVGDIHTQSYRNFAKFIRKIASVRKGDLLKIQEIEKEINTITVRLLFEKKWLLEKLNELKR